ncbi:MAG: methyltransferase domain-containing protein [Actinomycetota bacterium]|nr:methyltransferase domain-containing protein [Actinomycetota bacterium]
MLTPSVAGYASQEPWLPEAEGITDWGQDFHTLLLGDRLRMTAFRTAIFEAVAPGSIVVDLGTGTGILAQWALEAGAARVYGIDFNKSILDSAVDRITAEGHGARFHPRHGMSYDIELPERADVIISETLGNLTDNEGCVRILADARTRFLADDGVLLPSKVESYLTPVAATAAHAAVERGDIRGGDESVPGSDRLRGLGITGVFDTYYDTIVPRDTYLATPRLARTYEFTATETDEYTITTRFLIKRDGMFTGFKGYFIADLSPSVCMDISGDDITNGTTSDSWKHCYLPVATPVEVVRGDRLTLTFSRKPNSANSAFGQRYTWSGSIHRDNDQIAAFEHQSGVDRSR